MSERSLSFVVIYVELSFVSRDFKIVMREHFTSR